MTKLVRRTFPSLFPTDYFRDVNEIFEKAFASSEIFAPNSYNMRLSAGFPKGDMFVNEAGKLTIELACAGYSKDQLCIEVNGDKLTVSAKKCDSDGQERTLTRGSFTKVYSDFTKQWDLSLIDATYKDGLLHIEIPKKEEKKDAILKVEIK